MCGVFERPCFTAATCFIDEIFYSARRALRAQAQDLGGDQYRERRSWGSGLSGHPDSESECHRGFQGRC